MRYSSLSKWGYVYKATAILVLVLLFSQPLRAHVIVGELENMSKTSAAFLYLKLGYQHIIPLGFDHILFVFSLFLLSPQLKPLLWQATAFTVAHSVTLGLVMYHVITPPSNIVEPVIALSIMFVALENIFFPKFKASRVGVVFLFGLVHGMGFANALGQLGLPENAYFTSLVMFNIGVELGQISIILLAWFAMGKWFGHKKFYRQTIVIPLSALITVIACYWTVERLFF